MAAQVGVDTCLCFVMAVIRSGRQLVRRRLASTHARAACPLRSHRRFIVGAAAIVGSCRLGLFGDGGDGPAGLSSRDAAERGI